MKYLLILLLVGCVSPRYIKVRVTGSESISQIKSLGEFSFLDYQNAKKSLKMISTLTPGLSFTNSPKISWMDSKEFAGITLMRGKREILIDKDYKIKRGSNIEYFNLGRILYHELGHLELNMSESEVKKQIDDKLFDIWIKESEKINDYKF